MANGIEIRLFNGATAQASLTGLTCLWWDSEDVYDFGAPQGRTDVATTDADGDLILDISEISGHTVGGVGYLLVRKEDTLDHEDSLVFQGKVTVSSITGGAVLKYVSGWNKPIDWLAIDDVHVSGESRFEGLYAVFDGGPNWCAFRFILSGSAQYTIDWGDGSALEYVNSNVTAEHSFAFADLGSGTTTSQGYRQAIIKVTPTTGGGAFTTVSLDYRHSSASASVHRAGWLDIYVNGPSITSLDAGNGGSVVSGLLEQISCPENAIATAASALLNLYALKSINQFDTASMTSSNFLFANCRSLVSIPMLDFSSLTTAQYMFSGCYSLKSIPLLNFSALNASCVDMFRTCYSLKTIPLIDLSGATILDSAFRDCHSLQSLPALDFSASTDCDFIFNACNALQSLGAIAVGSGTTLVSAFGNCFSLQVGALSGTGQDITYPAGQLSGAQLDAIYTGLASAAKTITVTGNYGTASDDPTIATAKGWTVTS